MSARRRILLVLALAAAIDAPARVLTDLDAVGGSARYGLASPPRAILRHPATEGRLLRKADVDGDGHAEIVLFTGRGVVAEEMGTNSLGATWQVNVPPDLTWTAATATGAWPRFCDLGLAADINGDGLQEIFLTIADADRERWVLYVVDPATTRFALEVPLPLGPDRRANGNWDGLWEVAGILPPGQAGPQACVVLSTRVQYDAKPRGFTAVDVATGEIVWRFAMGGNIVPGQVWVGDLEGDGTWEIVAPASSPDNLGGETISGMSDDQSWLVVVGADGELRRCVPLGGVSSGDLMHVADLDSDGVHEIVTATISPGVGRKENLRVFTPDLELIARTIAPGCATGLTAVPRTDGSAYIFLATDAGILGRYRYAQGRIDPPDEAITMGTLFLLEAGDLLPEPGLELLIALDDRRRAVVLNEDLRPLLDTGPLAEPFSQAMVWTPPRRDPLVFLGRSTWLMAATVLNPRPVQTWPLALGGIAVAATAAGLLWRRRERRGRRDLIATPAARDVLSRLLFDLEQSSHGAVEVTRSLRRLQAPLSALRGGFEVGPRLRPHTRRTYEDFTETDLRTVREILDRADSVGFETATVRRIRQALERVVGILDQLVAHDLPSQDIDGDFARIKQDCETIEQGLQSLRRRLEARFSCDLVQVLDRVRWAREFDLERGEITVRPPESLVGDWSVLIEPRDLRFILDNLVGNAINAMAASTRRDLTINLSREKSSVVCRISDTGTGVPEHVRQRLFHSRFSTRDGGGLGLYRSHQLVNRWGGEIRLEATLPGKGSTFLLRLVSSGPRLRLVEDQSDVAGA